MMPKRRDWAKSVSESNNDLNKEQSWLLALWSVAGLEAPMLARDLSTVGRTVEKASVRWSRVLVSVVPAWPMGKAMNSTRPQYLLRAAMRGEYFSVFLSNLMSQPRSLQKPISTRIRVHCFFVEGGRVGRGSIRDPSCVDDIRCCAMSGFEQPLGLCMWEDPIRDAAWRCDAFFVFGGGGETPLVVSRV